MRKIKLICVGNLKERFLVEGCQEYRKRISRFFELEIVEIPEKISKDTPAEIENALKVEAENILSKIKGKQVFLLSPSGKAMSSEEFASFSQEKTDQGELTLVIGSSHGFAKNLQQRFPAISFGKMTFPHQLMRLIFLEQLYRAGTIINNIKYHK